MNEILVKEILSSKNVYTAPFTLNFESFVTQRTHRPIGFVLAQHSYNSVIQINGKTFLGCGEDIQCESKAREKSISEAIERAVFGLAADSASSNGWAAHISQELAALSAVSELIERDSAIKHWLTFTPMKVLEVDGLLPESFINELSQTEFPTVKILVSFEFSGPLVTVLLMNRQGHAISGHSSGPNLIGATHSATIEACRAAHHFQRFTYYQETRQLLSNSLLGRASPGMHSLTYAYHEPLPTWIFGEAISYKLAQNQWKNSYAKKIIDVLEQSRFRSFKYGNRFIVHAANPQFSPMFWGTTNSTLAEMFQSRNKNLNYRSQINPQPHMVG